MSTETKNVKRLPYRKIIVLGVLLGTVAIAYAMFGDSLTLQNLARRESALLDFRDRHPVLVYGIAFAAYVLVTGLSLPGAAVMTLAIGWYLGFGTGLLLVSFASTTGATMAFLLSRYLFRDFIQSKFSEKLGSFNENLKREGAFYLFTLRLIPVVPFFVINVVMGLTPMKTRTYWWVSQIGMLPGTAVFVYAGSTFPSAASLAQEGAGGLINWQLIVAFAALALLPRIAQQAIKLIRRR